MSRQEITTGDVTGVGIVIGGGSSVQNVTVGIPPAWLDASRALDAFMKLLAEHESEVPNADEVLGAASAMKAEVHQKQPNKLSLLSLLGGITGSVSGVAVLAEAAARISDAIAHIAT
jgi:hypothetical protein